MLNITNKEQVFYVVGKNQPIEAEVSFYGLPAKGQQSRLRNTKHLKEIPLLIKQLN